MSGEADAVADGDADAAATGDADPTDADAADEDLDTAEEIMRATYRALCAHGYADLTTQDIADESATSKAALHYHYDTKEELLLSFLDHLYDAFTDEYSETEGDHAVERLVTFVDSVLRREDAESDQAFQTALLEIRAQAPFAEGYRVQLTAFDEFVRERVAEIVADGIAEGTIREDVDPEDTAAFVATLIDGVNTRRVSIGGTDCGTRRTFLAYVEDHLVAPDADVVVDPDESPDLDESPDPDESSEPTRTDEEGDA
jgi:AcrR family transcriptional regulator